MPRFIVYDWLPNYLSIFAAACGDCWKPRYYLALLSPLKLMGEQRLLTGLYLLFLEDWWVFISLFIMILVIFELILFFNENLFSFVDNKRMRKRLGNWRFSMWFFIAYHGDRVLCNPNPILFFCLVQTSISCSLLTH